MLYLWLLLPLLLNRVAFECELARLELLGCI
jgi:hypothetical protein